MPSMFNPFRGFAPIAQRAEQLINNLGGSTHPYAAQSNHQQSAMHPGAPMAMFPPSDPRLFATPPQQQQQGHSPQQPPQQHRYAQPQQPAYMAPAPATPSEFDTLMAGALQSTAAETPDPVMAQHLHQFGSTSGFAAPPQPPMQPAYAQPHPAFQAPPAQYSPQQPQQSAYMAPAQAPPSEFDMLMAGALQSTATETQDPGIAQHLNEFGHTSGFAAPPQPPMQPAYAQPPHTPSTPAYPHTHGVAAGQPTRQASRFTAPTQPPMQQQAHGQQTPNMQVQQLRSQIESATTQLTQILSSDLPHNEQLTAGIIRSIDQMNAELTRLQNQ